MKAARVLRVSWQPLLLIYLTLLRHPRSRARKHFLLRSISEIETMDLTRAMSQLVYFVTRARAFL